MRANSPVPPYEQVRTQVVEMIESGALAQGDRLPPLRQLAADLGLAVGTVARAYRELEGAGLVRSRRGGGTRVVVSKTPRDQGERDSLLQSVAADYVRHARLLQVSGYEILAAVRHALNT